MGVLRHLFIIAAMTIMLSNTFAVPDMISPTLDKDVYSAGEFGEITVTLDPNGEESVFLTVKSAGEVNIRKVIQVDSRREYRFPFQAPKTTGNFEVTIELGDSDGFINTVSAGAIVRTVTYNFGIRLSPNITMKTKGESVELSLYLSNFGSETNRFEISFSELGTTKIPNLIYSLNSEERIEIPVTLFLPEDISEGIHEYSIEACSVSTKECKEETVKISVYGDPTDLSVVRVEPESNKGVVFVTEEFIFEIENKSPYIQSYTLTVNPPQEWDGNMTFSQLTFDLQPGERRAYSQELISENVGTFEFTYTLESSSTYKEGKIIFGAGPPTLTGMAVNVVKKNWIYGIVAFFVIFGLIYALTKKQGFPYDSEASAPNIPPI